ncbi:MAG: type II secretion system protein [Clostridium argentinense]|uniref:Type II secretion system protein n=1 Tax=Clostridium faecium TaxID=2762223 RepID=A0ABR8YQH1_9CLOT|nr:MULTISPECIES: type II secretion system protein [Clostridium]MBD8046492.1 type II secretion system protein [Clostridium faecium]MBS5823212.1 type II secretion system protein [Clostridium argentinense]MDU1349006.1 type II secretion system protein [Clostridium argentinense]
MSISKGKNGFILLELVVSMTLLLLICTAVFQTIVVSNKVSNINEEKSSVVKMMYEIEKIVLYNSDYEEFIRIEDKEVYITKDKLENYYKGNFSDVIQYNNPNNEKYVCLKAKKHEDIVKITLIGYFKEGEMPIEYIFYKGNY